MVKRRLKKALAILVATVICLAGTGAGNIIISSAGTTVSFSDVGTENPNYTAIIELAKKGIVTGRGDGKFYPDEYVAGEEVARMLFEAMKASIGEKDPVFAAAAPGYRDIGDIPTSNWAYNYIRTYFNFFFKEKKLDKITKQEFAVALIGSRRLDYDSKGKVFAKDPYLFSSAPLNSLADKNQITDIYRYFIELAMEDNVLKAASAGKSKYLYPAEKVTRGKAAQYLYDAMNCGINNFDKTASKIQAPRITANKRDIKVGIIIFDSSQFANNDTDANPDYTIFEALDRNINKPMDWNLVNPHPGKKTDGSYYLKETGSKQPSTDTVDQSEARKELFRYWEIKLSGISAEALANDYDVLFQTSHKTITMSGEDKTKIQGFIQKGGQMFWENCDGLIVKNNFVGYSFSNDPYVNDRDKTRYDQVPENKANLHPLLDSIFTVDPNGCARGGNLCATNTEVSRLGDLDEYKKKTAHINNVTRASDEEVVVKNINPSNKSQDLPSIICKSMGQGRLIVSANDTACGICDIVNGGGNGVEDFKFWYNLLGWMSRTVVDFNKMDGITWVNVDPENISITATVTNLGTREKDYYILTDLDPEHKDNNWELIPGSYTPVAGSILEVSDGYPYRVHIEPGDSMNITYNLRVTNEMRSNFDYKFKVSAVDNLVKPRDMDSSVYTLHTNEVPLNNFNLLYQKENNSIGTAITSYFNIELKSPLTSSVAYAIKDTYVVYLKFYKSGIDGALKAETVPDFVKSVVYEGTNTPVTPDGITGNQLKLTMKDIGFSAPDQLVRLKVSLSGLENNKKYYVDGYVVRQTDSRETSTKSIEIPFDYSYGSPGLTSRITGTDATRYQIELTCTVPSYTDGPCADNRIEIYKGVKNGDVMEYVFADTVYAINTNNPVDVQTIYVPKFEDCDGWFAKAKTRSTILGSTGESPYIPIAERVDLN